MNITIYYECTTRTGSVLNILLNPTITAFLRNVTDFSFVHSTIMLIVTSNFRRTWSSKRPHQHRLQPRNVSHMRECLDRAYEYFEKLFARMRHECATQRANESIGQIDTVVYATEI